MKENHSPLFPMGGPNDAYARYFTGHSFLKPLTAPGGLAGVGGQRHL